MRKQNAIIILFLISSCAFNPREWETFGENDDIEKEGIDTSKVIKMDEELSEKFEVKETPPVEPAPAPKEKKEKATKDKVKAKKKVVKSPPKKKVDKKKSPFVISSYKSIKDYSKDFIKYDKTSREVWRQAKPNIREGEKSIYEIDYAGITIGKLVMKTMGVRDIFDRKAYFLSARLKSAPFYSYIYEIDDQIQSYIDTRELLPIKYTLHQDESSKVVDDVQMFDWKNKMTYFRYKKVKKGQKSRKEKDVAIPTYFQDSFSSLFFLRWLPLKVGDTYEYPVITRGKIWLITAKVTKNETLGTELGQIPSHVIEVVTRYTGEVVKEGVMKFWISNDSRKIMLKFEAEVKIGSVSGEIISHE